VDLEFLSSQTDQPHSIPKRNRTSGQNGWSKKAVSSSTQNSQK